MFEFTDSQYSSEMAHTDMSAQTQNEQSSFGVEQNNSMLHNNNCFTLSRPLPDQSPGYLQVPNMQYHVHPSNSSGLEQTGGSNRFGPGPGPIRGRSSRSKSPALAREGYTEAGSALVENKCPHCLVVLVDAKGLR